MAAASDVQNPAGGAPTGFDNSYARLPPEFFAKVLPTPVVAPRLVKFNAPLADALGLHLAADAKLAAIFSGNVLLPGSEPLAMAYAGHQFGHFVPQLGDGRAVLLGEIVDRGGARRDIQLKGSGRTPFSRGGDGRAALGPVLREYLVSEAFFALGVPATRALAAVTTGEWVARETRQPGAIVTRVAASHVRVGTFQYFAARGDIASTRCLADHVIARHYPHVASGGAVYLQLLHAVVERHALLVARWMLVGFIHGVMNTDNMTLSGETIDFGPCAFMDDYAASRVFSSIDHLGRYAYANQPHAARWNLARFAETLLPLIDEDPQQAAVSAGEVLSGFMTRFEEHRLAGMRAKLGLVTQEAGDAPLVEALLQAMQDEEMDFTLTFRGMCAVAEGTAPVGTARAASAGPRPFDDWMAAWKARAAREAVAPRERAAAMRRANPAFIPRNHRIEGAIQAALHDDFAPFDELSQVLGRPFDEQPAFRDYADAPLPAQRVLQTFCGT